MKSELAEGWPVPRTARPVSLLSCISPDNRVQDVETLLVCEVISYRENARLGLRALFRTADRFFLGQRISQELTRLFELDDTFAEVLHLMGLAPHDIDVSAMLLDTGDSFPHGPCCPGPTS